MLQLILMISGAALIVVGIVLVAVQMLLEVKRPHAKLPSRSLDVAGPFKTKAVLKTPYPGLEKLWGQIFILENG